VMPIMRSLELTSSNRLSRTIRSACLVRRHDISDDVTLDISYELVT
jgi:hypothetical protein